jgi:hypothetical protein
MNYNDIEDYFAENMIKKSYTELSLDKVSKISVINSVKESYDFDCLNYKIKTSDAIIFSSNKIILAEFKNGNKISELDIRLKSSESILSLLNFILENKICDSICFPNSLFQFYLVYNRNKINSSQVVHFGSLERKLKKQYSALYSKFKILNQDKFKQIFRL